MSCVKTPADSLLANEMPLAQGGAVALFPDPYQTRPPQVLGTRSVTVLVSRSFSVTVTVTKTDTVGVPLITPVVRSVPVSPLPPASPSWGLAACVVTAAIFPGGGGLFEGVGWAFSVLGPSSIGTTTTIVESGPGYSVLEEGFSSTGLSTRVDLGCGSLVREGEGGGVS